MRVTTFDEPLTFAGEPHVPYESEEGRPLAMAPAAHRHQRLCDNLESAIRSRLPSANSCLARMPSLQVGRLADHLVYRPDLVATFEPIGGSHRLQAPRLIIEINSPGARRNNKESKLRRYGALPSAEEIWLLESEFRWVMIWRRAGEDWVGGMPHLTDMRFVSRFLDAEIAVNDLYTDIEIDEIR